MHSKVLQLSNKIRRLMQNYLGLLSNESYKLFARNNEKADSAIREQHRLRRLLQQRQTADFYYLIDIVGTCNLRCPSCPVGNYAEAPSKGLMSAETYQAIVEKISREHPGEKIFIDLYNWGEPGLHKQLSEIVNITKNKGYGVGISTNLNVFPDMKRVIASAPSYIRISLSGYFNHTYQQTHKRGDINLVKANMHLLRHWMDQLNSNVIIQVGFHIYRSNFQEDFWKMKQLCEDLGFIFSPTLAALMPVEKAVKAVDGEPLLGDEMILENLVVSTQKRVELLSSVRSKYRDCQYRQVRTTINFDGSVPLCCATFEKNQIIADHFLDISREEIRARKYKHSFCKVCQKRSLDMVYTGVEPHLVDEYAISELGQKYKSFLTDWNVSLEPKVVWQDKELTAQEAYNLATKYESKSNLRQAKQLYEALIAEFPRHGDALSGLGRMLEREDNLPKALECYESALAIWTSHQPYIDAVKRLRDVLG